MLSLGVLSILSSPDSSSALQVVGIHPEIPPAAVLNHFSKQVTPAALLHQELGSRCRPFHDTGVCPRTSYPPGTVAGEGKEHCNDKIFLP